MEERGLVDLKDYDSDEEARYSAVLGSGSYKNMRKVKSNEHLSFIRPVRDYLHVRILQNSIFSSDFGMHFASLFLTILYLFWCIWAASCTPRSAPDLHFWCSHWGTTAVRKKIIIFIPKSTLRQIIPNHSQTVSNMHPVLPLFCWKYLIFLSSKFWSYGLGTFLGTWRL